MKTITTTYETVLQLNGDIAVMDADEDSYVIRMQIVVPGLTDYQKLLVGAAAMKAYVEARHDDRSATGDL